VTNAAQLRRLSPRQIQGGVPVQITGIVTYSERLSNFCFVQDSTGGLRVVLAQGEGSPIAGSKVVVSGLAGSGGTLPSVIQGKISALGAATLPAPVAVRAGDLRATEYEYREVALAGVVQAVKTERPGLMSLDLRAYGTSIRLQVPASTLVITDDWIDSEIRAYGVFGRTTDATSAAAEPMLWVWDAAAIEKSIPARPPAVLPVTPIRSLLALDPASLPAHRVRVRGASGSGDQTVADKTGQIGMRMSQPGLDLQATRLHAVPDLDVAGFLVSQNGRLMLDRVVQVHTARDGVPSQTLAPGSILTTALEVHSLPLAAAELGYPVHLRAVVTYFEPFGHLLFVQDRTDGVFVRLREKRRVPLRAGDLVDVSGVTMAGGFAPDVTKAEVVVLGRTALPETKSENLEGVLMGRADCQWIQLEGIVQQIDQEGGDTLLAIAWGRETYHAHVLGSLATLASLVDAEVSLRGVCGALFNGKRQLLGIQMYVPGREYIRVLRAAPKDPFSQKTRSIEDLLRFSPARDMEHRVRLQGTVTHDDRSGSVWIRDATGAVLIQDGDSRRLTPGDVVDVVGVPEIGPFSPILRRALVRRVQSGPSPNPERITAQDAMKGDFDAQLVQMDGKLIDRLMRPAGEVLTLESGETIFSAILPRSGGSPRLEPGAVLRLTGICAVEVDQSHDVILPRTFRLLVRSPADIVVLSGAPWLTAGRVTPVLAGTAVLIVAALAWAGQLRKRVNVQTGDLVFKTIQLQEANRETREALQKAREAESLELDRKRILELVARDQPIDKIIEAIAEAIAVHCKNAACVILLAEPQGRRVCIVPAMPAGWLEALERIEISSISFAAEFREPRQICGDPEWASFLASHPGSRFRSIYAVPIVVDGGNVGAVIAFFMDEKPTEDAFREQISLWSSIAVLALERRRLYEQLSFRAQYDGLTGLPNRALLYERLESEIALASRNGSLLGILYVDLDGFKETNDVFGHGAGDAVLQEVSRRMIHCVRRGDTVGRIGGDEFVVLLPLLGRREDAEHISAKITAALRQPVLFNQQALSIGASLGIGIWPLDGEQADLLLKSADAHMYREKNTKRRRWYEVEEQPPEQPVIAAATGRTQKL
jgi:diguanylate cyclase (GGDEF)-like protein